MLFFLTFAAMSLVQVKRKYQARQLKQKCETLHKVAKGAPKSTVACKYNVPNNTFSTWIKNKDKIIQSYRECGNVNIKEYNILHMKTWIKLFTNGYLW